MGNHPILEWNLPCWMVILPSLQGNKHFFQAWLMYPTVFSFSQWQYYIGAFFPKNTSPSSPPPPWPHTDNFKGIKLDSNWLFQHKNGNFTFLSPKPPPHPPKNLLSSPPAPTPLPLQNFDAGATTAFIQIFQFTSSTLFKMGFW